MPFDLKTSNQSQTIEHQLKAAFYQKLHDASKKTRMIRLTGVGVGIVSSFISVSTRVALICENMLKGAGNVFGSPFFKKCELKTGLIQLLVHVPKNIFILPFSIFAVALNVSKKTVYMGFDSINYTYKFWLTHAPEAKIKGVEIEAEREKFQKFTQLIEKEPENLEALKFLGISYNQGVVVEKDKTKAFELFKRAASLGDTFSMNKVGVYYLKNEGTQEGIIQAYEWFKKSADLGDATGMHFKGHCLCYGFGVEEDKTEAVKWLEAGAEKGCKINLSLLAKHYHYGSGVEQNYPRAVKWFREAAEHQEKDASSYLGILLLRFPNLERYPDEKSHWLWRSSTPISEGFTKRYKENF